MGIKRKATPQMMDQIIQWGATHGYKSNSPNPSPHALNLNAINTTTEMVDMNKLPRGLVQRLSGMATGGARRRTHRRHSIRRRKSHRRR